jgi:Insertion element 4 transposase N-terminal
MLADLSSRIRRTAGFQYLLPFELPPVQVPEPGLTGELDRRPSRGRTEFAWGLVSAVCPPQLVDRIIDDCGRREQRHRLLPARLVVYALLLRCWYHHLAYQRVLRLVQHSALSPRRWQVPCASAFLLARDRLGPEVMKRLFLALAGPLGEPAAEGCWWRGRRLMALDGTTVEVAPTDDFELTFSGPAVEGSGRKGRPQLRLTALIECGTRSITDLT